jgi:hypothetical protein
MIRSRLDAVTESGAGFQKGISRNAMERRPSCAFDRINKRLQSRFCILQRRFQFRDPRLIIPRSAGVVAPILSSFMLAARDCGLTLGRREVG